MPMTTTSYGCVWHLRQMEYFIITEITATFHFSIVGWSVILCINSAWDDIEYLIPQ